jgi:hypothetical protein
MDRNSRPREHSILRRWINARELRSKRDVTNDQRSPSSIRKGYDGNIKRGRELPVGPWPKGKEQKLIGLFWRTAILDGLQGIAMGTFGRGKKWSPEEIEVYLIGVRKALMDNSIHTYWPYHIITAQKPLK